MFVVVVFCRSCGGGGDGSGSGSSNGVVVVVVVAVAVVVVVAAHAQLQYYNCTHAHNIIEPNHCWRHNSSFFLVPLH